ncbi:hypothetical protein NDU88_009993 [Pleurodeles waltl]|uniref:Uncharacterized protein n=1 Tax=Pleurodeles waltl TaxID=8319 RepID=A0AAV7PYR8_PLEWA|nr:hypothetical protein NDU88_009993 [Pleurodeles waltl]
MKAEPERRPKASERLKRGAETSREKNERKYARNAGRGAGPVKKVRSTELSGDYYLVPMMVLKGNLEDKNFDRHTTYRVITYYYTGHFRSAAECKISSHMSPPPLSPSGEMVDKVVSKQKDFDNSRCATLLVLPYS